MNYKKLTLASFAVACLLALALGIYLYTHPPINRIPSDPEALDNITFYALGDQGDGGVEQWAVARAMEKQAERIGKVDFITLLGDNFYTDEELTLDSMEWRTKFENVYSGKYLSAVPFYAVLGNNDPATVIGENVEIEYSLKHMGSNRWRMPANYYSYDFGKSGNHPLMRLVFLDTNLNQDEIRKQADFIREKFVESKNGPIWKIVIAHHPVRTYGKHLGEDEQKLAAITTALKETRVDLYLAGHDHNQQVIAADHEPVYVINGGGGAHTYKIKKKPAELIFARQGHGFVSVHANATQLDFALYDTAPQALVSYKIERSCPAASAKCLQTVKK